MNLSASEISIFLLILSLILFVARAIGEVFRIFKQPNVVGEILAGIILGPTILGALFPSVFNFLFVASPKIQIALNGLTTIAVVLLLLISGLEVDLSIVLKQGKAAILTSFMGIVFPFAIGFTVSYFFPNFLGIVNSNMKLPFSLFIGTALSITALPVVARTLMDLNIFKTEIGFLIIASAMLNDLIGWIIFSVILGMIGTSSGNFSFELTIVLIFVFIAFMLLIGRKLVDGILPFIQTKISFPGGVLNFILIIGFLAASFTEYIGIHAIFGAFIAGIAIGDSAHLKESTRDIIQQFVTNIFAPLFFVSIGLRVNFIQNFDIWIVLIFLVLAFAGKVIGCGLGAYWGGLKKNDALAIGFGMNSRGAMEIVLGALALQYGLIQEKVFVGLVIMAIVTSISSAPFMNYFLRERKLNSFVNILKLKYILFTNALSRKDVISELTSFVAKSSNLDEEFLFNEIWKREEEMPTGIANYLAIPHARVEIKYPIIAVAVSEAGIDFEAADSLPAKIIILLLTPKENNELQLQLLSEIAKSFNNRDSIESLLKSKTKEEFYDNIKNYFNSLNEPSKALPFIEKHITV